jgi:hypothetical protein
VVGFNFLKPAVFSGQSPLYSHMQALERETLMKEFAPKASASSTIPSVTPFLYTSNAADRDNLTGLIDFISSDVAKTVKSLHPAWRA